MTKCEQCEKDVSLPFECKYCGKTFCQEHRIPESHQCPNLSKEKFPHQEPTVEKEHIREGELYFTKELKEGAKSEKEKPKRRLTVLIPAVCITLLLLSAIAVYASYDFGYNNGNRSGHQAGYQNGNLTGYSTGYAAGYIQGVADGAGRGYNIRDPTYQEALQFIGADQTDKNPYNSENYTCIDFAADVKNNAFKAGYRSGYVEIWFPNDVGHTIICFNTTDHGLVFIEPQDDSIMKLVIGQPYWDTPQSYNDTVIRFAIFW